MSPLPIDHVATAADADSLITTHISLIHLWSVRPTTCTIAHFEIAF